MTHRPELIPTQLWRVEVRMRDENPRAGTRWVYVYGVVADDPREAEAIACLAITHGRGEEMRRVISIIADPVPDGLVEAGAHWEPVPSTDSAERHSP